MSLLDQVHLVAGQQLLQDTMEVLVPLAHLEQQVQQAQVRLVEQVRLVDLVEQLVRQEQMAVQEALLQVELLHQAIQVEVQVPQLALVPLVE